MAISRYFYVMILFTLFSCGEQEKNTSTINIWLQMHYETRKVLREVCDQYEAQNPAIQINLIYRETEELRSNFQSSFFIVLDFI